MLIDRSPQRVLIASGSEKSAGLFSGLLASLRCRDTVSVSSAGEAKRLCLQTSYDIIIINTPLSDEFGTQLALDLSGNTGTGIMLLVKSEHYEQIAFRVEEYGVLTLPKPIHAQQLSQGLHMLLAVRARLRALERKNESLRAKMDEIRIVNRAKWVLITQLKMDEAQAHHYIERQAMDTRTSRREVAESVIKTYES